MSPYRAQGERPLAGYEPGPVETIELWQPSTSAANAFTLWAIAVLTALVTAGPLWAALHEPTTPRQAAEGDE